MRGLRQQTSSKKHLSDKVFWSKVFKSGKEVLVAICDEELLDRTLIQGRLRVKISSSFYGGSLVDDAAAEEMMRKSTSGNLFGKKIIALAEKAGFITKENIILIDGVPHTQFVNI